MARMIVSKKDVQGLMRVAAMPPPGEPTPPTPLEPPPEPPVRGLVPPGSPEPPRQPDPYLTRLLKYIPSEIIAVYVACEALLRNQRPSSTIPASVLDWIGWCLFAVLFFCTYLYLWRIQRVTKQLQLLLSCLAFAIWVFTLGGPFAQLPWYSPLYGALLLPVYTLVAGIIEA